MSDTQTLRDKELKILECIHRGEKTIRQRDVARIVGLSLGMTNEIIRRLVERGFLKIQKVNGRNIRYLVSSKGLVEIRHRSFRFIKRTIRHVVTYREAIETIVDDVKRQGFESLALVGPSDLDFIVEYACAKKGVQFIHGNMSDVPGSFRLYSERYLTDPTTMGNDTAFLREYIDHEVN